MVENKGRSKRKLKYKCGKFGLGMCSGETSEIVASDRGLAETGCVHVVRVDLNELEVGAVLVLK